MEFSPFPVTSPVLYPDILLSALHFMFDLPLDEI
jgi:hypothetical protein